MGSLIQKSLEQLQQLAHISLTDSEPLLHRLAEPNARCIWVGMGKSGHVAAKLAASFNSLGIPSFFLHPSEALHGDVGLVQTTDTVILISHNGTTPELVQVAQWLHAHSIWSILITSNPHAPLLQWTTHQLILPDHAPLIAEIPAPVIPAVQTMLVLDVIGLTAAQMRGFEPTDFARLHPSGQIGRNLLWTVDRVMHPIDKIAVVQPNDSLKEVILRMTMFPLGAACVIENDAFVGIITDGDIRRYFTQADDIKGVIASQLCTRNPITISANALLKDAIACMEHRPSRLSVLPVVQNQTLLGLIRIHDMYA